MNKQEILEKIGELASKATVVEHKNLIEIPFHRITDWGKASDLLAGFTQGSISFYIHYDADSQPQQPTLKEQYEEMNEAEQIQADLAWINMGGWLDEAKLARLRKAGHQV